MGIYHYLCWFSRKMRRDLPDRSYDNEALTMDDWRTLINELMAAGYTDWCRQLIAKHGADEVRRRGLHLLAEQHEPPERQTPAAPSTSPVKPHWTGLAAARIAASCDQCVHRLIDEDGDFAGCNLLRACGMNLPRFLSDPAVRCPWPEGWGAGVEHGLRRDE